METRTVLRGGVVLSMDPNVGDFDRGDVLIENGAIVELATSAEGLLRRSGARSILLAS